MKRLCLTLNEKSPFHLNGLFSLTPVAGYAVGGFYAARVLYMPVAAAEVLRSDVFTRGQVAVLFRFFAHYYPPKTQSIRPYMTLAVMP